MTKLETDFAEEDLAMARRALWLLVCPTRMSEQPPADLDLRRLSNFTGVHGGMLPLAHFARIREDDAMRSGRLGVTVSAKDEGGSCDEGSRRHTKVPENVRIAQNKANERLREVTLGAGSVLELWRAALQGLEEIYGGEPPELLTGEPEALLVELMDAERKLKATLERMDRAMRWPIEGDPFPSLLGLPKAERNASLNSQALRLHEAGHSPAEIAYVMGWVDGPWELIRKRMRVRLDEARAGESGGAHKGAHQT